MAQNNTQIVFLNKPQGVTSNQADSYSLFQEYFRGKNYELIQRKDHLESKIKGIKAEVDETNRGDGGMIPTIGMMD